MGISESDLPGIGRRYELDVRDGDRLVAVVRHGGQRDLYAFRPGAEEARGSVSLDADSARQLGAIISGNYYRPAHVDSVTSAITRYSLGSATVSATSTMAGRSILELELRRQVGVTVVAILAAGSTRLDPSPATVITEGDTVVVVGQGTALSEFTALAAGHALEAGP